jgi:hypothetical protein
LPLFRCARLLALDISGAMRPKAYVISADAMRRRELIRRDRPSHALREGWTGLTSLAFRPWLSVWDLRPSQAS